MSITTTSTKDSYTGNNSTSTPYPITFKYLEDSHITVYVDGVALSNSYYTLTGDGSLGTGQFTTALEYASTQKVVVVLDVPFNQPVELLETGALSSSTLEEAYDRLNMQIRRVWRKAQSVLTFSTDEGGAGSQGTADNMLGFDGTGNLTEIPNATFAQAANNSTDVTLSGTGTQASLVGQALTINKVTAGDLNSESATVGQVLQADGDTTCSFIDLVGGGNAQTANPLSQFASTTSAQLASVISDKTGTGALVFADAPTIDLTNATNTPLPASGTVTETMLNASINASLAKADGSVQVTAIPSVTGTATFTNSTNRISLTGVGSLTGLAVGDVIEVTGSTSNNDVFTVTDVSLGADLIEVNDAHAGKTTSKSLTLETATASVTVTLVCKANKAPLGYGQGWVNVSRFGGSTYTNTTGRAISYVFNLFVNGSGTTATSSFTIAGLEVFDVSTSELREYCNTYIIQNNDTYGHTWTNGTNTDTFELR